MTPETCLPSAAQRAKGGHLKPDKRKPVLPDKQKNLDPMYEMLKNMEWIADKLRQIFFYVNALIRQTYLLFKLFSFYPAAVGIWIYMGQLPRADFILGLLPEINAE